MKKTPVCSWCKMEILGAMGLDGEEGKQAPGDVGMCINCGKILIKLGANEYRKPTAKEAEEAVKKIPELAWSIKVFKIWKELRKKGETNAS